MTQKHREKPSLSSCWDNESHNVIPLSIHENDLPHQVMGGEVGSFTHYGYNDNRHLRKAFEIFSKGK